MDKKDNPYSFQKARLRMLNRIAERALARGRKLTPREKINNLEKEFGMTPGTLKRARHVKDA